MAKKLKSISKVGRPLAEKIIGWIYKVGSEDEELYRCLGNLNYYLIFDFVVCDYKFF
jgi:hypothetical protein